MIGASNHTADAALVLKSYGVFWNSVRRGTIGFAESFIAGECETSDLPALFRFFIDNRQTLSSAGRGHFKVRARDRNYHAARANSREGSRDNIAAHYDLGNAFYACWLDASMTYSSALFTAPGMTLEAAQTAKYDLIFDALTVQAGHRILEIGCGWGACAARLASYGAMVTGLTLSRQQFDAAQTRLAGLRLSEAADIRIEDYRDTTGTFDRIVSIEMIEAVGEENWPDYFAALRDRLAPDGIAVVQAITIQPSIFDEYRRKADFIQRYIFPGGMLPTERSLAEHAAAAGLTFERVATFGASYVETLGTWRQRFHAAWPRIEALGFDDRFRRTWDYYLAYCEAGFDRGAIDVGVYRFQRTSAPDASLNT